jgi:hypothetical protein
MWAKLRPHSDADHKWRLLMARAGCLLDQFIFFLLAQVPKKRKEQRLDSGDWYMIVMCQLTKKGVFLGNDLAVNKVDKFLET